MIPGWKMINLELTEVGPTTQSASGRTKTRMQVQPPKSFPPSCREQAGGRDLHPRPHRGFGCFSHSPTEHWMSPHAVDDDCSGWTQQQGGHDDDGGQDDEDNGPDIQDVLGKHGLHGGLADGIHAASLCKRKDNQHVSVCLPPWREGKLQH